ncbi:MAG TPA: type IX secretion system membrane protein PorP/SprF [Phaeodactylibacter sp.]|nr:type IX secretion system membrane protein PorP/SprF [Phaeodactylibacter sp.]
MQKRFTQFLAIVLLILSQQVNGQDTHFSQFYMAPLQLNPAMTGVFEGSFRVVANYREQYNSILASVPFRTVAASFDMRKRVARKDYFSFGVSALQDQAGDGLFAQYRGNLSVSFMKQLGGSQYGSQTQYLVAGAQVGAGQNRINPSSLWFSAQFDNSTVSVNHNTDNLENFVKQSSNIFLDFNAGLMWYARMDESSSIYFGGALNHIAPAQVTLYEDGNEPLYMRWVGHGGGEFPLSRNLSILPAVLVMGQGPSLESNFGANFRYTNHDWREVAIRAGAWGRISKTFDGTHFDALIFSAILEMERWNLGVSYDVNASSLKKASQARGGFEVSLIYVHPTRERFKVHCPKF